MNVQNYQQIVEVHDVVENTSVQQDRLIDEARGIAHKLMRAAPLAQQVIKRAIYKAMFESYHLAEFIPCSRCCSRLRITSRERELLAEKREPAYDGREDIPRI